MIKKLESIKINNSIEFIDNWIDEFGNFKIDKYIPFGKKYIINKKVTGCGFTTYSLCNKENTILVSPRLRLIHNKLEQSDKSKYFYFNREQNKNGKEIKTLEQLDNELLIYIQQRIFLKEPLKILVTYDSFVNLVLKLEFNFGININSKFRIVIDESHCIIKDIKLKEYNNKSVLSNFLKKLFTYNNLLFISATPILDYLNYIKEFQDNDVYYYEIDWGNISKVSEQVYGCKNPTDAFDKIYKKWNNYKNLMGDHYFYMKYINDVPVFSYEAVIFLNSVLDICRILNKYINKEKLIDPKDISILCANTKENYNRLRKVDKRLTIQKEIPKKGELHTRWLFVTRTCFEGVDFYSTNAMTYVIANYNVESLSLDISTDIPQIIGRQRLKENVFRNIISIYYTNNQNVVDDEAFLKVQELKMEESKNQISIWNTTLPECKKTALENINIVINSDPNKLYISTVENHPEINPLIIISENYCRDILKNQKCLYVINDFQNNLELDNIINEINSNLSKISNLKDKMKLVYEYIIKFQEYKDEILNNLWEFGYIDIYNYFTKVSLEKIKSTGFNTWKINNEIDTTNNSLNIENIIKSKFNIGQKYVKKYIKEVIQNIYNSLNLNKTAKSTDLEQFFEIKRVKMTINGKREEGFEILKIKN